jgi:hypothetical protein
MSGNGFGPVRSHTTGGGKSQASASVEKLYGWPGVNADDERITPYMGGEHDFGWDVTTPVGVAKIRNVGGTEPWRVVEGPEVIRLLSFRTAAHAVDTALDLP